MTIQEMLGAVQFVVNPDGKRTAAMIDIDVWEAVNYQVMCANVSAGP